MRKNNYSIETLVLRLGAVAFGLHLRNKRNTNKASYQQWNYKNAFLIWKVSKSSLTICLIKVEKIDNIAWNFHKIFFTQRGKIISFLKMMLNNNTLIQHIDGSTRMPCLRFWSFKILPFTLFFRRKKVSFIARNFNWKPILTREISGKGSVLNQGFQR